MPRIHFVYAVPPPTLRSKLRPLRAAEVRAQLSLDRVFPMRYRAGRSRSAYDPTPAPFSITVNLYRYLSERAEAVALYDWRERGVIDMDDGDILLGHPHPDETTIVQRTMKQTTAHARFALLMPLHYGLPHINSFILPLLPLAELVFGIMGTYWYDGLQSSQFSEWKDKIIRIDMAVDGRSYPFLKTRFNPPGVRGFLYIGNNAPEKGCEVLSETMARLPEFRVGWVGKGPDIPNVPRFTPPRAMSPDFVTELAHRFDFLVNTSVSDANPTTILEAMAWGFPVACTPQSGYDRIATIPALSTIDIDHNVAVLSELQSAPEDHLHEVAKAHRKLVESHYTWERFGSTIWEGLRRTMGA